MHRSALIVAAAACVCTGTATADTLYQQPQGATGATITSAYSAPDGNNSDEFTWDNFTLAATADITEVRWRGTSPGAGTGGTSVSDFEVSIWQSIGGGSQPLLTTPLVHYLIGDTGTGQPGNAYETFAGAVGGTNFYDYHFTLPAPFHAVAGTRYWVQIIAWQPGWGVWGLASATGGNGSHFARVPAVTGDFRFIIAGGDNAFTLVGTPSGCTAPSITAQPANTSTCSGMSAVFHCTATGSGTLTYQWRSGGVPITNGWFNGATASGATTDTLTLSSLSSAQSGTTVDCVVSNGCATATTGSASLTVNLGPQWSYGPVSFNNAACPGGAASFTVSIGGSPAPGFQWQRDGIALANGVQASGTVVSGATSALLTLTNLHTPDAGAYRCVATNGCGVYTTGSLGLTVGGASCGPVCDSIDFNGDGLFPDTADIDDFLSVFSGGPCSNDPNCGDIDFNNDGLFPDTTDIDSLLSVFSGGWCL